MQLRYTPNGYSFQRIKTTVSDTNQTSFRVHGRIGIKIQIANMKPPSGGFSLPVSAKADVCSWHELDHQSRR
jgi:hypothetical protein